MSLNTAPGRPSKGQVKCNGCKVTCLPKNGDWFFSPASDTQQVFLCRSCERTNVNEYKRTIPVR